MKVSAIKQELEQLGAPTSGLLEKPEFVEALLTARMAKRQDDATVVDGTTSKMPKNEPGGGVPGGMGGMGGMPGGMGGMPGGMGGMPGGMGGMPGGVPVGGGAGSGPTVVEDEAPSGIEEVD